MIDNLIDSLKEEHWYKNQITHVEKIPATEPEYETVELSDNVESYLDRKGIKLYTHQAEAIENVKQGRNVIITTATASGKTLAFNIPVLERVSEQNSTALYIYPTKALSNDQLETVNQMISDLGYDIQVGVYDGDTPKSKRRKIREEYDIIITNPHALHQYLPWHRKWSPFFKKLDFVVIDEVHQYRGVFGSNVAMLFRRMKRVLDKYGSEPQFILSSATIANPEELSENLVDEDFIVVDNNGSSSGEKYFIMWNPVRDERSVYSQTVDFFTYLLRNDFQTLCFTNSRRLTELITRWSRKIKGDFEISPYRAGYKPDERREIESGLRKGEIDGVVSTNALEVGIDIGGLDAVIMTGYPGTIISTWQQAGRAGRDEEEALSVLMGYEDPLNQYFIRNPKEFFDAEPENAIVDLDNPYIKMGHLLCAASELPVNEEDNLYDEESIEVLEEQGLIRETALGYVYSGTDRPVEIVKLDNIGDEKIKVMYEGELLETMDKSKAFREAHPGAVLIHDGETYIVTELDIEKSVANVKKEDVDYHTEPLSNTSISIEAEDSSRRLSENVKLSRGDVNVTKRFSEYVVKRYEEIEEVEMLDLPALDFKSSSFWLEIDESVFDKVIDRGLDIEGGLHAVEHAVISMIPLFSMCDRWDVGGVSTRIHPETGKASIFIYDAYEGGIGISEKSYELCERLLSKSLEMVRECDCDDGCPSCIYSPKCGNRNEPLDKESAILILSEIVEGF